MLKKMLMASGIFMAGLSDAMAGFYLGPTLTYDSIRAGGTPRYLAFAPSATGGYATRRDYLQLAGEIFISPTSIEIKDNPTPAGGLKTTYSYGVSIVPGIWFDDFILGYGRVGFISAHFNDPDTTKSGYQVGIGLQTHLTETWSIRGEYDHAVYHSISNLGTPKADQWAIGLLHHFG